MNHLISETKWAAEKDEDILWINPSEWIPIVGSNKSAKLIIDEQCYIEFGRDLDGCSRQQNEGCNGCRCTKMVKEGD